MKGVNLSLPDLKVRQDAAAHVALEFNRGTKWSQVLVFEPRGLCAVELRTEKFLEQYSRSVVAQPLERSALSFLRSLKGAYLPGDGVSDILIEVYIMAKKIDAFASTKDEVTAAYNELAATLGKPTVKGFKDKPYALKRLEDLKSEAAKPTIAQQANKAKASADAERRLASVDRRESEGGKAEAKKPKAPAAAKGRTVAKPKSERTPLVPKVAKPAKATDGAPKKPGVGAFCNALILGGKSNEEVLAAVRAEFPNAKTQNASVSWYRSQLIGEGKLSR